MTRTIDLLTDGPHGLRLRKMRGKARLLLRVPGMDCLDIGAAYIDATPDELERIGRVLLETAQGMRRKK